MITSTRKKINIPSTEAIIKGISDEGGLFLFETLKKSFFKKLDSTLTYSEVAFFVMKELLLDFNDLQIKEAIGNSYNESNFIPEPVSLIDQGSFSYLNLYNGPTFAFKDMALSILPYLLKTSKSIQNNTSTSLILTATSGDTGSAALNGFQSLDNTKVVVLYPEGGVSQIQEKQMLSYKNDNTFIISVKGNFDDCQNLVKKAFKEIPLAKITYTSANSINIGRLVPQIVYYFYSYLQLVKNGTIQENSKINYSVPTGNFGNIFAAYLAKEMGLPINKLICASNSNNVLTDFFNTGTYTIDREFYKTYSPSMDIIISSNLERFLYLASDNNVSYVKTLMSQLKASSTFNVNNIIKSKFTNFYANYITDEATTDLIKSTFENTNILIDPHTAVALGVYNKYLKETNDDTHTIIVSTANPYKFPSALASAFDLNRSLDDFEILEEVAKITNKKVDQRLLRIKDVDSSHPIWEKENSFNLLRKLIGTLDV
ncbi:MAG: threonine synthase [Candidatus Izemoplasma sp.]